MRDLAVLHLLAEGLDVCNARACDDVVLQREDGDVVRAPSGEVFAQHRRAGVAEARDAVWRERVPQGLRFVDALVNSGVLVAQDVRGHSCCGCTQRVAAKAQAPPEHAGRVQMQRAQLRQHCQFASGSSGVCLNEVCSDQDSRCYIGRGDSQWPQFRDSSACAALRSTPQGTCQHV